ncbi:hypothetical protein ES703_32942 [subsurface metagenome]
MTTAISAAPTMSDCNKNFVATDVLPASGTHITDIPETSQITESSNSCLAAIGAEILKPPPDFTDFSPVGAKTLPPVPAALFMVLTGFLCVSLVKNRRVWLAALAGLLWAGQAGFQAIPQLASNISKKHIQQKSPVNTACLYRVEDCCRLRSDIEGTQYIGLLHYLAVIPAGTMSLSLPASLLSLPTQRTFSPERNRSRSNLVASLNRVVSARTRSSAGVPQFAITHFSSLLNPAVICPAARSEQNTYFSPAFIFQQLPRGPPNQT